MKKIRLGLTLLSGVLILHPATSATEPALPETNEIGRFTVHVLTEKEKSVRQLVGLEIVNGRQVRRLERAHFGTTVEVPVGTFVLLRVPHEKEITGFTVYPPGVLEPAPGYMSMPAEVVGVLRAVGPGTTTITLNRVTPPKRRLGGLTNAPITLSNWSGYALRGGPFSGIRGSWTVPTVDGDLGPASASWIGIDGFSNTTLIQTGTAQNWNCGWSNWFLNCGAQYYAWWELTPGGPSQWPYPVSPGDRMQADIHSTGVVTPGSPMTWQICLTDVTANWGDCTYATYSGTLTSAEWIEEAPTNCIPVIGCSVVEVADYGSVTFDIGDAVTPGGIPGFTPASAVVMVQGSGIFTVCSTPSNPDADGDGFTVAPTCAQPSPPGPFITTASLSNGAINRNYQEQLQVSGDSAPQWQLTGGTLPPPLSLNASGVISGFPNTIGTFNFTVQARDNNNPGAFSQMQPLSITVMPTELPSDFQLTAGVIILQSEPGGGCSSGSTTVSAIPLNGFNGAVSYSVSNLWSGATGSFTQINGNNSTLTVSHAPSCPGPGSTVTVAGISQGLTHQVQVPVQVLPYHHGGK
jgi:hypothetical protein